MPGTLSADVRDAVVKRLGPGLLNQDGFPARFLVVDDSQFARENLRHIVESFGGELVAEAENGIAAITEYERLHPDVVLMDITMPEMDGITAVEKLVQRNPKACVIMVSSVGHQENIAAALQRGARHFVQKPIKPEVLYQVIEYVLQQKR
jgi:two-component system chemotaxis response regulator CheY